MTASVTLSPHSKTFFKTEAFFARSTIPINSSSSMPNFRAASKTTKSDSKLLLLLRDTVSNTSLSTLECCTILINPSNAILENRAICNK